MPEQPVSMPEILAPASPEAPALVAPPERRRPNVIALVLLAIGFGLAVAAQYLPWGNVTLAHSEATDEDLVVTSTSTVARVVEVPLTYLSPAHVAVYLITLTGALTALAVVLTAAGPGPRRIAAGVTAGLLAANVLVLVGLKSVIDHVGSGDFAFLLVSDTHASHGPGYLLAYAAVLILAATLVMAIRAPVQAFKLRRDEVSDGGEPLELTVTPVPPTFQ